MKKLILFATCVITTYLSNAQWTDSGTQLTTEDYVGIGTTSPDTDSKLTVNGAFTMLSGVERLRWSSKHSGETDHRNYLAPRKPDDSGWDWGQEFGYHHYNRAWYFDSKVGIGTNNPKTLLSVGYNPQDPINSAELFQLSRNADAYMTIRDNAAIVLFGSTSGLPFIGSQSPSDFTIRTANTERVRITSTGNVGIGTSNPQTKLSVEGLGFFRGSPTPSTPSQGAYIGWNALNGGTGETDFINNRGLGGGGFAFYNTDKDGSNRRLLMFLNGGGHLGIGNSNPKTLLSVGYNPQNPINSGELFQLSRNADAYMTIRDNAATVLFGSTSGLPFIGSQSPSDFTIRTANTERVRITSTGNVGIGTSSPKEILQLGDRWTFHNGGHKIIGYNYYFNGSTGRRIVNDEAAAIRFVDDGAIHFQTSGNGSADSPIAWTEALSIKNDGNVGIGTTIPHANLHVEGYNLLLKNAGSSIHLRADGNHSFINNMDNFVSNGSTGNGNLVITGQQQLRFATGNAAPAGTIRMLIDANGNVGIGTTNPGTWRLAVNGNIRAKEIVVETGWSDFVFESDYKLPTLEEVEQHIKDKGHLKDIPNAKAVEENGIQLGEMNSKLLQKIEELTLYLIEEHKENKMLLNRIEQLEKILIKKRN